MKTDTITGALIRIASLTSLFVLVACSAGSDPSGSNSSAVNPSGCAAEEAEDEANDRIVCAVDADCDSDEVCVNALCTGLDGDVEDDEACEIEGDDDADDADDADDTGDEDGADRIKCVVDADCDSDEVCTNGLCT